MKPTHILLALIMFISLISCDSDSNEYPIEYTSNTIVENNFKVYTKDGDISNHSIGKDYIERYKDHLPHIDKNLYKGLIKANYTSSDTIELSYLNQLQTRSVHQDANLIYWEALEISKMYKTINSNSINYYLHKPLFYEEFVIPTSTGYSKTITYKHCYYLKLIRGKLKYPLVDILIRYPNGVRYNVAINNEFDKSCVSELTASDTLLVQEYWVEMI